MQQRRRLAFFLLSVLVSAVLLWFAIRDVDLQLVFGGIRRANPFWITLAFAMNVGALWTRAVRWRGLIGFRLPLLKSFHIINITFLGNLLPMRAGEVIRSVLASREGVPFVTAATSIVVERLLDTLLVLLVLAAGLAQLPEAPPGVTEAAIIGGVVAVIGFIVLLVFARYPGIAHSLLDFFERVLPFLKRLPLRGLLDNVLEGLQPLTNLRSLLHASLWTVIAWAFSLATFYALQRALDIQGVNLQVNMLLAVSLAAFSIALPVTVASIGPFELAVNIAGEAVGMNETVSSSLGFLFHGVVLASYLILGTISLLITGTSLSETVQAAEDVEEDAEPEPAERQST